MSARTPLARRVIAAALMVLLTGCYSWQPTTVGPAGWTPEERPSSVRGTLTSGETITVRDPIMRNDSIVGATDTGLTGVASRNIRLLEVQRLNVGRTIANSVLLGVGVFAVALGVAYNNMSGWGN